jgi:hypothetical protein
MQWFLIVMLCEYYVNYKNMSFRKNHIKNWTWLLCETMVVLYLLC